MSLDFDPQQAALRAEARAWLEAHVPREPLVFFDLTREGFEAHREWEADAELRPPGMVSPGRRTTAAATSPSSNG